MSWQRDGRRPRCEHQVRVAGDLAASPSSTRDHEAVARDADAVDVAGDELVERAGVQRLVAGRDVRERLDRGRGGRRQEVGSRRRASSRRDAGRWPDGRRRETARGRAGRAFDPLDLDEAPARRGSACPSSCASDSSVWKPVLPATRAASLAAAYSAVPMPRAARSGTTQRPSHQRSNAGPCIQIRPAVAVPTAVPSASSARTCARPGTSRSAQRDWSSESGLSGVAALRIATYAPAPLLLVDAPDRASPAARGSSSRGRGAQRRRGARSRRASQARRPDARRHAEDRPRVAPAADERAPSPARARGRPASRRSDTCPTNSKRRGVPARGLERAEDRVARSREVGDVAGPVAGHQPALREARGERDPARLLPAEEDRRAARAHRRRLVGRAAERVERVVARRRPARAGRIREQRLEHLARADSKRSNRSPIGGSGIPNGSCSPSCQPAPRPRMKRPPVTWSSTVAAFASSTGGGTCSRARRARPTCRARGGRARRPWSAPRAPGPLRAGSCRAGGRSSTRRRTRRQLAGQRPGVGDPASLEAVDSVAAVRKPTRSAGAHRLARQRRCRRCGRERPPQLARRW